MSIQAQKEIYVPALMDGDKIIVSQAWLGASVEYRRNINGQLSAVEYQRFNPPTLAELRHAFFDKYPDGSWISSEYRQSVLTRRRDSEWTSTFLRDGKECVERPEKIYFDNKRGLWIAEGGKVSRVELPNDGWTLEYDKPTGFPSRTSRNKKDAEKVFGDDTSYFWSYRSGLRAVLRTDLANGSFCVGADFEPSSLFGAAGARSCRRSEQDASRPATPMNTR